MIDICFGKGKMWRKAGEWLNNEICWLDSGYVFIELDYWMKEIHAGQ